LGADVDGDPVTYDFVAPAGCAFGPQYPDESDDHKGYVCAQIECDGPARYDFTVEVYDMAVKAGAPIRIEDWLALEGYPNESHAQLIAPIYFEKKGVCGCEGQDIDIVFLEDRSGSFGDDIHVVAGILPGIEAEIAMVAAPGVARFGAASYVDKPIGSFGGAGDYVYKLDLALGASATPAFPGAIFYGGDGPEAQLEGLLQLAVNAGAAGYSAGHKYAVLMTDANFHQAGDCGIGLCTLGANNADGVVNEWEDYPSKAQLKAALEAADIVPVFAVTLGNEATYQALADELGRGKVVTLSNDSSNLRDVLVDGLDCE
jgi:hypothetical protein